MLPLDDKMVHLALQIQSDVKLALSPHSLPQLSSECYSKHRILFLLLVFWPLSGPAPLCIFPLISWPVPNPVTYPVILYLSLSYPQHRPWQPFEKPASGVLVN